MTRAKKKDVKCPYCGSSGTMRFGFSYAGRKKQRRVCKSCGKTFFEEVRP